MAGTTNTLSLKEGDRCIIYVDDVNSPSGWWIGRVTEVDRKETFSQIHAVILAKYSKADYTSYVPLPLEVENPRHPSVNYRVYEDSKDTRSLIDTIHRHEAENHDLRVRLNELRQLHKVETSLQKDVRQLVETLKNK